MSVGSETPPAGNRVSAAPVAGGPGVGPAVDMHLRVQEKRAAAARRVAAFEAGRHFHRARVGLCDLAFRPGSRAAGRWHGAATQGLLAAVAAMSSPVGKMRTAVIRPSFQVLVRSGRTASFGELNAQSLPRDDAVRGCFVPSAGHVYIKADYATVELATLAQAVVRQFGLATAMGEAINYGQDLHRLVAARVTGKPESAVIDDERRKAKPINFGKPGAMGNAALQQYAKASYGVILTDGEVAALSDAWLDLVPEMVEFLRPERDRGEDVARMLGLTPRSHVDHSGSRKFLEHPANAGRADLPHPILGFMALKALRVPDPTTQADHPYQPADVEYFWSRLEARLDLLPATLHA